jgi:hypothetical protein
MEFKYFSSLTHLPSNQIYNRKNVYDNLPCKQKFHSCSALLNFPTFLSRSRTESREKKTFAVPSGASPSPFSSFSERESKKKGRRGEGNKSETTNNIKSLFIHCWRSRSRSLSQNIYFRLGSSPRLKRAQENDLNIQLLPSPTSASHK